MTAAQMILARCSRVAACTEIAGETTRLSFSTPMHEVHGLVRGWMEAAGMSVAVDAAGNLRGLFPGSTPDARRLLIGSHLDTVPNAGAFDGVLGVLLGVAVVEELRSERLPFAIEVIGFADEEGVRFGKPFVGSLALVGALDADALGRTDQDGVSVAEAMRAFGGHASGALDAGAFAYLEVHIEQGPVLEAEGRPVGVVEAIAGQSRLELTLIGQANHAGTTPMRLRHDALAAAAHWMVEVEQYAASHAGLVATVGRVEAKPGAVNVIPGEVVATLDVRHARDAARHEAVAALLGRAEFAAARRGVSLSAAKLHEQAAVPMDARLVATLQKAAARAGFVTGRMTSGAGHDAMIVAAHVPAAMLFVRSPEGLSHHPDESVLPEDMEAALAVTMEFVALLRKEGAEDGGSDA